MDLIKDVKFFLALVIFLLSTLSCSAAIVVPTPGAEKTKSDRSGQGISQYMGYGGQGYGLGYGRLEYPGAYPPAPVPGLVPPYANGGGYLGGLGPPYSGYYPPYGEFLPPPAPYPIVPPIFPVQQPLPYPRYYPGIGYNQYSAKKGQNADARA